MAKVPGDTRIPMGTRVQAPGATKGAVRRTLQTGISVGSRLLPSKLKIPGLKPRTKSPEISEVNNAALKNNVMKIVPQKIEPFTMCNKHDIAEKTFDISTDNRERTFDVIPDFKEETFTVDKAEKTFNVEDECENKKERLFKLGRNDTFDKETDFSKLGDHIGTKVDAVLPDLKSSVVRIISGILKYVGHVQMDDDIWCGIEADKSSKDLHDGSLNGVKYFSCERGHGLLVPATQIKLQNQTACVVTDSKILELKNKLQTLRSKPSLPTNNLFRPNVVDITKRLIDEDLTDRQGESGPYSLLVGLDTTQIITEPKNYPDITMDLPSSKNRFSSVGAASTPNDGKHRLSQYDQQISHILNQDLLQNNQTSSDFTAPLLEAESMIEFQSINFDSPMMGHGSLVVSMPKASDTSSSQCETPPEVLCLDKTAAASTPLEEEILMKTNVKSVHTPKPCTFVDKITSREDCGPKKFILGPPTRKQNTPTELPYREKCSESSEKAAKLPKTLAPSIENRRPKSGTTTELPSPTVSDNSVHQMSKQNSFDESLGILTPDQMDSMSFLDNVRSPSVDDLNDLLDSSKTTEKTVSSNSQTPSTENLKSLTPDAIKLLLSTHKEDEIPEDDSNLKEATLENENCTSVNVLDETVVYTEPEVCHLMDYDDDAPISCDNYDNFVQRPFKQSTAENLSNIEICSTTITQTIEDELLPSVHSSILDPLSSVVDTTVNLDLPLDSRRYDNVHQNSANRMDQTPSPEELPLDPIDMRTDMLTLSANQFCNSIIQEQSLADSETKTDTTKSATSKVSNSFITSITSITSLDGYQGDGEMSRPVSRGADQSPTIGHRAVHNNLQNHWQNIPINRRPDPMTDSDFFTESDADGHDEQVHRGDRRAQVIDGALYGGGKASNPPVLVSRNGNSNNEDSCMESSGVFTDMETQRCSPLLLNAIDDLSPDGSSPSIRSELSQKNNSSGVFYDGFEGSLNGTVIAADMEASLRSPGDDSNEELVIKSTKAKINTSECKLAKTKSETSNISNATSDKMNKEEKNMALKKYKMPRRDVASKVKTMLSTSTAKPSPENDEKRASPKASRKGGRWDAVMNKISANKTEAKPKSHLKDIKSKVTSSRSTDKVRGSFEDTSNTSEATGPKTRTPPSKLKSRRVRSRLPEINMLAGSGRSSPHSSQSDVSISGPTPPKTTVAKHNANRAAKKRDVVAPGRNASPQSEAPTPNPPAHVNTRLHTPPAVNGRPPNVAVKKPGAVSALSGGAATRGAPLPLPLSARKPAPRRPTSTLSPKSQPHKDQNRASSPASKASGVVNGPVAVSSPILPPAVAASPQLHQQQQVQPSQQVRKPAPPPTRGVEALAVLVHYLVYQLDALNAPKWRAQAAGARVQLSEAATRLQRALQAQRADQQALAECLSEITRLESELVTQESKYNARILAVTTEHDNKYRAALEDSAALSNEIRNLKVTLGELKKEVGESRARFAQVERAGQSREAERRTLIEELKQAKQLADDLRRNQSPPCKQEDTLKAEVESLKAVLELKIIDLNSLRKQNEELEQAACRLPAALQRSATLADTAEDLRAQLERKLNEEANLLQQNKQLQESFTQMAAQKNRLCLYNEELQYKLKHNTEVVNLIAAQSGNRLDPSAMASPRRGALSSSFSLGEGESDRVNHSLPADTLFVRGHSRMTASFNEKYLHSTNYKDRRGDWRSTPKRTARQDSSDIKPDFCDSNRSIESIQMSDCSPPNSPKIKGVVEKNDSVSWVVEIEEAPEETASRYVRRGGSFRTSSSPPGREALKRQRSRPKGCSPPSIGHLLSQSASASCLEPVGQRGGCKLFRSGSVEHKQFALRATSTPTKENGRRSCERGNLTRPRASSFSHEERNSSSALSLEMESLEGNLIYTKENNLLHKSMQIVDDYDTESLVSNGDLILLQECEAVPKESAGEALISGTNSEDDVSLDDPSHSSSDCESVSECDGAGERPAERALAMVANNITKDLSAAPMEYSWSEDGECPSFNADM